MALRIGDIIKATRQTDLIITPQVNPWLMRRAPEKGYPPHVIDWVTKQLQTKARDRSKSFSASSAGACYRAQELQFLGMPGVDAIDPQLALIFEDGKWRHLRWQAMGLTIPFLYRAEMPLYWRNKLSRGTIDGLGMVEADHPRTAWRGLEYGFELKGVNPFQYQKAVKQEKGTKEEHKRQIARYFLMGDFDLFVTIYENKATQQWFEWVEEPDQDYIDEQRAELEELNDAIKNKQLHDKLPSCAIQMGNFKECDYGQNPQGSCFKAGAWPGLRKR